MELFTRNNKESDTPFEVCYRSDADGVIPVVLAAFRHDADRDWFMKNYSTLWRIGRGCPAPEPVEVTECVSASQIDDHVREVLNTKQSRLDELGRALATVDELTAKSTPTENELKLIEIAKHYRALVVLRVDGSEVQRQTLDRRGRAGRDGEGE
ncbi:hypothetical protein [uncultured Paludibaculum sp.]|uniref:hypothetical protein n=1 Tax=uncultured Paludibaculum sp. TaxID=1765020 RepID=UPI002AAC0A7D|nr:hypothetical protein [uncultured Paludibaculum sp.]